MVTFKEKLLIDFSQIQDIYNSGLNKSLKELVNIYFELNMPIFEELNLKNEAFNCKELCLETLLDNDDSEMVFEQINDLLVDVV